MIGTKRKQSGFSIIVTILAIVVVGALAATGLLIYQRYKPTAATNSAQTANQQKSTTTTQSHTDPYADWKSYTDIGSGVASGISIKYPPDWHVDSTSTKSYGWSIVETANTKNIITVNDIFSDGSKTAQQEWESCYTTDACLGSTDQKILASSGSSINGLDAYTTTIQTNYGTYHMTMIRGDKPTSNGVPYVWFTTYITDQAVLSTFAKIMASATFPN